MMIEIFKTLCNLLDGKPSIYLNYDCGTGTFVITLREQSGEKVIAGVTIETRQIVFVGYITGFKIKMSYSFWSCFEIEDEIKDLVTVEINVSRETLHKRRP